jgi:hypothetical protein
MSSPAGKVGGIVRSHPLVAIAIGGAALALAVVLLRSGSDQPERPIADPAAAGAALLSTFRAAIPLPELTTPEKKVRGPSFPIARVQSGESVDLRAAPGGRVIERLGDETEFGSPRALLIGEIRGDWFGVVTSELPNGVLGWIRDDRTRVEVSRTHYWLSADISERALGVYYGKRLLDRYSVTVGAPGTDTPPGAFAVTDALAGPSLGPYYGCCILALSGHQPNLPEGWFGGDRMAIHGTPGAIGVAESAGCLRTSDVTMVELFARVPLGAPVFVNP